MIPNLEVCRMRAIEIQDLLKLSRAECYRRFDAMIPLSLCSLSAARAVRSMSAHVLNVYRSRDDFDVVKTKLRALSDYFSIDGYHGTTVVIETVSVATLLVRI